MADLDLPGLAKARAALTSLAKNPRSSHAAQAMKMQLVEALYPEIRAARFAGYSWKKIYDALRENNVRPYMSINCLAEMFSAIDKKYEKETGVKALPRENSNYHGKKKKSPGLGKAQDSIAGFSVIPPEEIIS